MVVTTCIMVPEEEREAVRVAAIRALLRSVATPDATPRPIDGTAAQAARLLLSGRDVSDICNALALPLAAVYGMLIDLAR